MDRKVVIAGGSGFIGSALSRHFSSQGWQVVILSRNPGRPTGYARTVAWDGASAGEWVREIDGADAVVNLAGRSIACLHTPENQRQILDSRINAVRAVDAGLARCSRPPPVLVQASAVGLYGDAGGSLCDEQAPKGLDFVARVVADWEESFFSGGSGGGQRRVALRIGFVLGREGGALKPLARLTRAFLGGAAGGGRQYLSWIHIDDLCRAFSWAVETPSAAGPYNAVAPEPEMNVAFMRELRRALRRPWSPPAPAWAVRLAARYLMRVEPDLILGGCRCIPLRLQVSGFCFRHANLRIALGELLAQP